MVRVLRGMEEDLGSFRTRCSQLFGTEDIMMVVVGVSLVLLSREGKGHILHEAPTEE